MRSETSWHRFSAVSTVPAPGHDAIRAQLARILESPAFQRSHRSSALLRYVVERTLAGETDRLKEYTLGAEALDRGVAFDPRTDPTVRAEASRLRERLERYYESIGADDPLLIELPRGGYVPRIVPRAEPASTTHADSTDAGDVAAPNEASRPRRASRAKWFAAAGGLAALLVVAVAVARSNREAPTAVVGAPLQQFDVDLRVAGTLGSEVGPDVVLSPDGTRLVFVARDSTGLSYLYVRRFAEPTAVRLAGTEGARVPFLSPDGRWVGFWARGKVKRTAVDGGSPVELCDATDLLGASWGTDGQIVAAINPTGRLWRIPEAGGAPRPLVDLTAERALPSWPQMLPGGAGVIYTALTGAGADRANVEVYSIDDDTRRVLVRGGTFGRYLPGGWLAYVNQGTLYAVPFDSAALEVRGPAVPLLGDVAYSRTFGYAHVDVARTGTLVHRRSARSGQFVVAWVDREGRRTPLLPTAGRYDWPSLSRNGRMLALSVFESGAGEIRVIEHGTGEVRRISTGTADQSGLAWWPDGSLLLFGGRHGLSTVAVGSSSADTVHRLSAQDRIQVPWSLDSSAAKLAYHELDPTTGFDLWTVRVTRAADGVTLGPPEPFLRSSAFEVYPALSADGNWIAYSSNESGRYEIYVRAFPDHGGKVRVSTDGGRVPRWSPNGRELLYQTDHHHVMVASYRARDGAFVSDVPRPWGGEPLGDTGVYPGFDVAPDGERLVALFPAASPEERQARNHVTILLNFLDEVRRRTAAAPR
jgi:serine/threonine-protein kinase